MGIGSKIKAVREALRWPQVRLAEQVGMSQQALQALESRDSKRSLYFAPIARAFGVTLEDLLTLSAAEIAAASVPYESPRAPTREMLREPDAEFHLLSTPGDRQSHLLRLFDELTPPQQAHFLGELDAQVKSNRAIAAHMASRRISTVEDTRIETTYGLPKK